MGETEDLEELYRSYNRRDLVHPDPVELLYPFPDVREREMAGILASSLAYGNVRQIVRNARDALERMSPAPRVFLERSGPAEVRKAFRGFKHRFTTGGELSRFLEGLRRVIGMHGSLESCFMSHFHREDDTILPALRLFVEEIRRGCGGPVRSLAPSPADGSACKRLNLFMRWMVRRDEVDPGGWNGVSPSKLVIPLDTHMHRTGLAMGLTRRRSADLRTALEITAAFRAISPEDPVRYDFALTRLGILKKSPRSQEASTPSPTLPRAPSP